MNTLFIKRTAFKHIEAEIHLKRGTLHAKAEKQFVSNFENVGSFLLKTCCFFFKNSLPAFL